MYQQKQCSYEEPRYDYILNFLYIAKMKENELISNYKKQPEQPKMNRRQRRKLVRDLAKGKIKLNKKLQVNNG